MFSGDLEDDLEDELGGWDEQEDDMVDSSFVCEDCDYRWDGAALAEELDMGQLVCPMCGSVNVTQL
ncbi:MAG: hypothetical protein HS115_08105 [Spirochaetales bacterium]|nr:hypothetical protein [Spirochaetales bacterium]